MNSVEASWNNNRISLGEILRSLFRECGEGGRRSLRVDDSRIRRAWQEGDLSFSIGPQKNGTLSDHWLAFFTASGTAIA